VTEKHFITLTNTRAYDTVLQTEQAAGIHLAWPGHFDSRQAHLRDGCIVPGVCFFIAWRCYFVNKTNEQIAVHVARRTISANILLTAFQMFAGIFAGSVAMISDAMHSLSDIIGTFVAVIGIKLANRKADKDHPYGHERMECVAAVIMAFILFIVGALIGLNGLQNIFGDHSYLAVPGRLALIAAVVGIAVKEAMFWYTIKAANKIGSTALKADAWHSRSYAFSSIGSFAGILGARMGFPVLDSVAAVVICLFILRVALGIFKEAVDKMTDKACDDEFVYQVCEVVLAQEGVKGIDNVRTRLFGDKIYVDVEISANSDLLLSEAHDTAHRVHDMIESTFPNVKHCMVHVNPHDEES